MQDYFGEVGVDTVTKILKLTANPNRDDDMSKIEFPLVTRHLGAIDPESLEAYAAVGGYASLKRALTEMTPEAVLDAVESPACGAGAAAASPPAANGASVGKLRAR